MTNTITYSPQKIVSYVSCASLPSLGREEQSAHEVLVLPSFGYEEQSAHEVLVLPPLQRSRICTSYVILSTEAAGDGAQVSYDLVLHAVAMLGTAAKDGRTAVSL